MSKSRVKTNNGKTSTKKAIREKALSCLNKKNVLEVFCGGGVMFKSVYSNCEKYKGIDIKKYPNEQRDVLYGNAPDVLREININNYNFFDIDAYGSPYECLNIIVDRLKKVDSKVGFAVTDGSAIDMKMGRVNLYMRQCLGTKTHIIKKAHLIHSSIIKKIIKNVSDRLDCNILKSFIAKGNTGASMMYYSFILESKNVAESS